MTYMPEGFKNMSQQELWDYFHQPGDYVRREAQFTGDYWARMTGLDHRSNIPFPSTILTIDMQRTKIMNLKQQMAQMNKGYNRKIDRLEQQVKVQRGLLQGVSARYKWMLDSMKTFDAGTIAAMVREAQQMVDRHLDEHQ